MRIIEPCADKAPFQVQKQSIRFSERKDFPIRTDGLEKTVFHKKRLLFRFFSGIYPAVIEYGFHPTSSHCRY